MAHFVAFKAQLFVAFEGVVARLAAQDATESFPLIGTVALQVPVLLAITTFLGGVVVHPVAGDGVLHFFVVVIVVVFLYLCL